MSLIFPSLQLVMIWMITMNGSPSASVEEVGNRPFSIRNMACLFYDENHMNCTWDIDGAAPSDTQYCLSYGFRERMTSIPCHNTKLGKVACHVQKFEGVFYENFTFCAMGSCQQSNTTQCRYIVPAIYYKASPPVNITVNRSEVVWKPPIGKHHSTTFEYQIQVKDLYSKVTKVEDLDVEKWVIKDLTRSYAVQVRARINHFMEVKQKDFIWSDWTDAVITGKEEAVSTILKSFAVTIIIIVLMVLLLMFICKRNGLMPLTRRQLTPKNVT
ncbi:interleukin-13 receptor subunit alpha-2-like isoform X2 [Mobula hypostoma]|uniref:interleukin-13 receptor subunit alpha-2-like isoform X2 n=1 Tax=Mobula hypostoma TaxID=723540 RepID=UPI002FC2BCC0